MKVSDVAFEILPKQLKERYLNGSERSRNALKNIVISIVMKGINILVSLLLVPLTISYVNPTRYGIWLTLSSIIGWMSFMDLGLSNGFRNKFAESLAKGEYNLARKYVSTTYFLLTLIAIIALVAVNVVNYFIDWTAVLGVDAEYKSELTKVFAIVSSFFCINLSVHIVGTMLTADQKPAASSVISGVGQLLILLNIFILTRISEGSLINLAIFYSGTPVFVMVIASIIIFSLRRYKQFRPSKKYIDKTLVKNIFNLGIAFFVIQISSVIIFQMVNIIISREINPDAVTQYNIAYKYFYTLNMVVTIIVVPLWSASTEAFVKGDFAWLKNIIKKLELCVFLLSLVGFFMLATSKLFYKIWIGDSVTIPFSLSLCMLFYIIANMVSSVYINIINGIGYIRLQTMVYIIFALISWPVLTLSCRQWGVEGVLLVPGLFCIIQAIFQKVQLSKLIDNSATGIWKK